MLSIPGKPGWTCEGFSRREFLRVGGAGLFGLSLGDVFRLQALAGTARLELVYGLLFSAGLIVGRWI